MLHRNVVGRTMIAGLTCAMLEASSFR